MLDSSPEFSEVRDSLRERRDERGVFAFTGLPLSGVFRPVLAGGPFGTAGSGGAGAAVKGCTIFPVLNLARIVFTSWGDLNSEQEENIKKIYGQKSKTCV